MSNYQDSSSDPYQGAPPPSGAGYSGSGSPGVPPTQPGAQQSPVSQGAPVYQETSQFPAQHQQHQQHQQWSGSGASQVESHGKNKKKASLSSALKTTEFWVLVAVSLALLLASLLTDEGDDGQGFGAEDAWRYVTILAAAYMISRGLTKFGGRDEDHDDHRHH